jgi:hypothetical protein
MFLRFLVCLAALLPLFGRAAAPTRLDSDDVLFQFRGTTYGESKSLGSNSTHIAKPSDNRLCGFAIRGNHRSRANPHVEWDLNIDQIIIRNGAAGGVSAGTFEVTHGTRKPRPAITQLSFMLADAAEPVVAQIRGEPNADNGIVALLPAESAGRLFAEFQTDRTILISLRYADNNTEQLEVRGFRDRREFGGGKNSYFAECLRGFKAIVPGETVTTERH